MTNTIYFDMDGTIANLYEVNGWLESIINRDASPYTNAEPMVRMNSLARVLNNLIKRGYKVGIVSWLAKNSTEEYDEAVTEAKLNWLKTHLKSVEFEEIHIVPYGTPKHEIVENPNGILFDDEEPNRTKWLGTAYNVDAIIETLKGLK